MSVQRDQRTSLRRRGGPGRLRGLAAVFAVAALVLGPASVAGAIPPDGPSPNTPGTSSSTSPGRVQPGDRVNFTVRGFPAGETLYIKINDGDASVCSNSAVHGACVVHQQRIPSGGTVSGSLVFPSDLPAGTYWLRFLASEDIVQGGNVVGTRGFTLRGQDFTVGSAGGGGSGSSGGGGGSGSSGGDGGGAGPGSGGGGASDGSGDASQDGEAIEGDVLEIEAQDGADADATGESEDVTDDAQAVAAASGDDGFPLVGVIVLCGAGALSLVLLVVWLLVRRRAGQHATGGSDVVG